MKHSATLFFIAFVMRNQIFAMNSEKWHKLSKTEKKIYIDQKLTAQKNILKHRAEKLTYLLHWQQELPSTNYLAERGKHDKKMLTK